MFALISCLVFLGVAYGAVIPYGGVMPYGPGLSGLGYGAYGGPYYGYGSPLVGRAGHFNDMTNYVGDGRYYGNIHSNGLGHQYLGAAGAMGNGGGQGFVGKQRYADHQQGLGGYSNDIYGRNFNNGGGAFSQGNGYHDARGMGRNSGFNDIGHNKGHKTTGFHKSYHNEESGRDTKYVDENHDSGDRNLGQEYRNNFGNGYGSGFSGVGANGQFGSNRHFDQNGHHGLSGGNFNDANFGSHGANNFYNGQEMSFKDAHLADNLNNYGQGYYGNLYGKSYMPW